MIPCIKVKVHEQDYFLPADQIENVTVNPEIVRVPGAQENIAGIAVYQKQVVPYIYIGQQKQQVGICGIIVRRKDGTLVGFCAEQVSERIYISEREINEQITEEFQQLGRTENH